MAHTSVKISANSSDYQSQMKSAASQMKVLSSEFKLAQTQAKAFGSAADQLNGSKCGLSYWNVNNPATNVNTNIVASQSYQIMEHLTKSTPFSYTAGC